MQFSAVQRFDAPASAVIDAYRLEDTWRSFADLPFVGTPSLLSFTNGEAVLIKTGYRVSMEIPALARTFIDPARLTFVELTMLDDVGGGTFEILPDHYGAMLRAAGSTRVTPLELGGCKRTISGSVDVSLGWKGMMFEATVEQAIVNGLQNAMQAQADQVSTI